MFIFLIITGLIFLGGGGLLLAGFLQYQRGKENEDEEDTVRGRQFLFIGGGIMAATLIVFIIGLVKSISSSGVSSQGNKGGVGQGSPSGGLRAGTDSLLDSGASSTSGGTLLNTSRAPRASGYAWSFTTGDTTTTDNLLLLFSNPRSGEKDVCRNVLGTLRFNQRIDDVESSHKVIVEKKQGGEWQVQEGIVVEARVQGEGAHQWTEVVLGSPTSPLVANQDYRISLPSLDIVLPFSTGASICKIRDVMISVLPPLGGGTDLFTCAQDAGCEDDQNSARLGNQHVYTAHARDAKGTPLTASYTWSVISQEKPVISLEATTNAAMSNVTALPYNGSATVVVKATGPLQGTSPDPVWGTGSGSKDVEVFLCNNPWPRRGAFPFIDQATHFSFFYCRDRGKPGTEDDLPALRVAPVLTPSDPRALKEYIFPLEIPTTNEALGIKVMRNSLDRGPSIWYEENITADRQGAPTPLVVDGFQAVRDGTTTYVHAPNVSPPSFFTNMYLLSYTSNEPSPDLVQIWEQLVTNWRFAVNVGMQEKVLLARDTKRLGDMSDTAKLLDRLYAAQRHYPSLSAGSFVVGNSTSAWPSWQQSLGKELNATLPVDPLNTFGACPGFDPTTCWNEHTRQFAGRLPDNLPRGSHVYVYRSHNSVGSKYSLCAIMESSLTKAHNASSVCSSQK